jgi:hypothetical protein
MYEVILNSNTNGNNPNQEVPMYQTEYLDDEPQNSKSNLNHSELK